jgi:hypothetical protein
MTVCFISVIVAHFVLRFTPGNKLSDVLLEIAFWLGVLGLLTGTYAK